MEHTWVAVRLPSMKLIVASLVGVIACAHHTMPSADPRCGGGEILYHSDDHGLGPAPSREIRIWISTAGAWSYVESGHAAQRGCLDGEQLADVNAAISRATWLPLETEGDCFSPPGPPTEFYVRGQLVFTARSCASYLDEATGSAVLEIEAAVHDARGG